MSKAKKNSVNIPNSTKQESAEVAEVIRSLSEHQRQVIVGSLTQISSYSGPLPHPELFEAYNNILPGAAERILVMAEQQAQHRIKQEQQLVKSALRQKTMGMILGCVLTILILAIVVCLAIYGHPTLAGILGTTTLLGVISVFVLGVRPHKENTDKE